MKLMLTGSRSITDAERVRAFLVRAMARLGEPCIVIHGGADGFDTIADHVLRTYWPGTRIEVVRPD